MKILLLSFILLFSSGKQLEDILNDNNFDELSYFTSWATAVISINPPKMSLTNNTIRQIVHVSASGDNLRLKLSNKMGKTNLEIKEVSIANSAFQGNGEIVLNTLTSLSFNGEKNIIIPPGEEKYSDIIIYDLKALSDIAISIYLGETPEDLTGHYDSITFSFIEEGNKIYEKTISNKNKIEHWYFISAIEVPSNPPKKTIVCFGDSITDGYGSSVDKQNRLPDLLATKLHLNKETKDMAVVNKGIGGNKIITQGLERYSYDVLEVKGISHIIVLYGVNDINSLNATSSDIISAYKQIIKEAHKNNIFIFAGTILPYRNYHAWTEEREKYRQEVNYWIRNIKSEDGGFDSYFDFDKLLKDPINETIIYNEYDSGDGLHPSPEGYQRMVQAIYNLDIFTLEPNFDEDSKEIKLVDKIGIKFKLNFYINKDEEIIINIKGSCNGSKGFRVYSTNNEEIKTSDYYYSGKIENGNFIITNIKLKVSDISNHIVIRRPISTINIDNISFEYIEVLLGEKKKIFSSIDEGSILN